MLFPPPQAAPQAPGLVNFDDGRGQDGVGSGGGLEEGTGLGEGAGTAQAGTLRDRTGRTGQRQTGTDH